ncbi:EIICBA-Glc [Chlamydia trachomatis]|nr:EIICBA-Glc [Chlamydia trachomatis]
MQVIVGTNVEFVANAMKQLVKDGVDPSQVKTSPSAQVAEDIVEENQALGANDFVLPIEGTILPIEQVPDQVFAMKMMGDGFAIEPVNGKLVSPIDGEVLSIFPTNHALGLKMDNGLEILIHVGLDTVKLNGEGFTALVQEGQRITKGTPLLEIDLDFIKRNAPSTVTPIIFTNLPEGTAVKLQKSGIQKQNTPDIIQLEKL